MPLPLCQQDIVQSFLKERDDALEQRETALDLGSIVAAFFFGVMLKYWNLQ